MNINFLFKSLYNNHLLRVMAIYIVWISIHYISAHMYSEICTPYTIRGFLLSPFINGSPYCKALRWCIDNGSEAIQTMWIVSGTYCASLLIN